VASAQQSQQKAPRTTPAISLTRNERVEAEIRLKMAEMCQQEHLSSSLFPLNDVLIPPQLMAKIHQPGPDDPVQYIPSLFQTLPPLQDSPRLTADLPYPSLALEKVLQWSPRVAVCGVPGSGKSTLLADLVTRISTSRAGLVAVRDPLPIYAHARDLNYASANRDDALAPLAGYLFQLTRKRSLKIYQSTLQSAIQEGALIFFLDGLEELAPANSKEAMLWLQRVLKEFPALKVVTTSIPHFVPSLTNLGFEEYSNAPWTVLEKRAFISKFEAAWFSCFHQTEESALIKSWLVTSILPSSPLDMTLTCWSAFSGNPVSLEGTEIFDPYLSVVLPHTLDKSTLSSIAVEMVNSKDHKLSFSEVETILLRDPSIKGGRIDLPEVSTSGNKDSDRSSVSLAAHSLVDELCSAGILATTAQGKLVFRNQLLCAALFVQASKSKMPESWQSATQSSLWDSILLFATSSGKVSSQVEQWLAEKEDPLYRKFQVISHWLSAYPGKTRALRIQALKNIIPIIQNANLPVSLQIKLLEPLLLSNEPATLSFIKELTHSQSAAHRQAGAYCLAFSSSPESDSLLISLTSDPDPEVQKLACVSLGKSWSISAQKHLINLATQGSPELRQVVGELLAYNPGDGFEILKELVVLPNNPEARKAAVNGLMLVPQDWSKDLIKKVNIEDTEWLVRDTASTAIKLGPMDHLFKPRPWIDPTQIPWLLRFAASRRMGIYANEFPGDLLILAFKEGDPSMRAAALQTLAMDSSPETIQFLQQAYLHARGHLQELAYASLVSISKRGIRLQE
jgi:HEAT repeat protein